MKEDKTFLKEIENRVLIGDGALGTELVARGARSDSGIEKQNIIAPELVLGIHRDYIDAGSNLIETNTFGANRLTQAMYGAQTELEQIVREGVLLAKQAGGEDVYVAGSIGPLPAPEGEPLEDSICTAVFAEQIALLLDNNVDLLMFESFSNLDELVKAVKIARSMTDTCIVAQAAYDQFGFTADGDCAKEVALRTIDAGADVVGANCGYGIPSIAAAVKQFQGLEVPFSAFINAGFPEQVDGRLMYMSDPKYLAKRALDLVKNGVRLIGGCCGTNPESIRAMRLAISDTPVITKPKQPKIELKPAGIAKPKPALTKSSADWRVLVEVDPPNKPNIAGLLEQAKALKEAGADALTVADNPLASVRVDTLTAAIAANKATQIPVIPHLTGRDRNKIALQSTFMGAYVSGIGAFLCVTGDPIRFCQQPNTSGVFDVNSIGLAGLITDFNRSHSESDPDFVPLSIGVALNPNVRNLSSQIDKLKRKIDAGASFALTQPLFAEDKLFPMLDALAAENIEIPIYIGVLPLTSLKNAEFIHNEVPGIYVPDNIRDAMERYESVADQRKIALDFSQAFITRNLSASQGFYLITPRNRVELVAALISTIKENN